VVVQDVNRFLRGWAGYFRYGNSARFFDKIPFHALGLVGGFITKRHKQHGGYGWWVINQSPDRMGLINLNGTIVAPRPKPAMAPGRQTPTVENVGEPCAREPHARFEVAAGGNQASRQGRAAQAPLADPTTPRHDLPDQPH
jgi:Group II intron, maturase-specific domain